MAAVAGRGVGGSGGGCSGCSGVGGVIGGDGGLLLGGRRRGSRAAATVTAAGCTVQGRR